MSEAREKIKVKPHGSREKAVKKCNESVRRSEMASYKEMIIVMLEKVKKEENLKRVYKLLEYLWLNEEWKE